jgi:hypothetical protein
MRLNYYISAIIAALTLAACTTDIDIKLDGATPSLVVDGCVTTDTVAHTVLLKKTADYFSNKAASAVSGATVTLNDGTTTITLAEDPSVKGAYKTPSNYYGVANRTYKLTITNIDIDGDGVKETYEANCQIASRPLLERISVEKTEIFNKDMWAVKVWGKSQANEKNYYMGKLYKNNVCVSDSIQEWGMSNDEFIKDTYLNGITYMYFSSDKKDEILHDNDLIEFEFSGVTEDYKRFVDEAAAEFWGRNPLFGGQPSNIRTNVRLISPSGVSTSPHGFFAAYSIARASVVYKE